jgi:hypothetical protein
MVTQLLSQIQGSGSFVQAIWLERFNNNQSFLRRSA